MTWQPIKTMPQDGTPVLGYVRGLHRGHYQEVSQPPGCAIGQWRQWPDGSWRGRAVDLVPTHWMPLPRAPQEETA